MAMQGMAPVTLWVAIFSLFRVYSSVPTVTSMSVPACTAPAMFASPKNDATAENIWRPAKPPAAAPTASGVSIFGSILESPETFDLITE